MPKVEKQSLHRPVKTGSVLDRIMSIDDDLDDFLKLNLYGKSGSGKTRTWSTFPGPILAIIRSGGNKAGELKSVKTENRSKIKKVTLTSSQDLLVLAEYAEEHKFKTVVIDHISGLQDLILGEITGIANIPEQKSWGLATMQQYGQCTAQAKELLSKVLNLPCHVVLVAGERVFGGKEDGGDAELIQPFVASAVTPSLVTWVNHACDYICQNYIRPKMVVREIKVNGKIKRRTEKVPGEQEYCLRTAPTEVYMAKFRQPKDTSPKVIVDPSFDKIMQAVRGGR